MIELLGKECSKCGEIKPLSAFNRKSSMKCGYCPACKACRAEDYINARVGAPDSPDPAPLAMQPDATQHRAWQQIDRRMRAEPAQNLSARIAA